MRNISALSGEREREHDRKTKSGHKAQERAEEVVREWNRVFQTLLARLVGHSQELDDVLEELATEDCRLRPARARPTTVR